MKKLFKRYGVRLLLVVALLSLSAVAAFAQTATPTPPEAPTYSEVVDTGLNLILTFGIIAVALVAGVVWRFFLRGGRGIIRMGG